MAPFQPPPCQTAHARATRLHMPARHRLVPQPLACCDIILLYPIPTAAATIAPRLVPPFIQHCCNGIMICVMPHQPVVLEEQQ